MTLRPIDDDSELEIPRAPRCTDLARWIISESLPSFFVYLGPFQSWARDAIAQSVRARSGGMWGPIFDEILTGTKFIITNGR